MASHQGFARSLCFILIAFVVLSLSSSGVEGNPQRQQQHQITCAPLAWKTPYTWYGGHLLEKSYKVAGSCDQLITRNDLYLCESAKPYKECSKDSECSSGQLCGQMMFPRYCVVCNTSNSYNTWYEQTNVTVNVTESMLRGHFWNKDEFYNHTGVDLILTLERWVWSPNMKALQYDWVQQYRSTWGDASDDDRFAMTTQVYDQFNATHIRRRFASAQRDAMDKGDVFINSSSGEEYLSVA